jgi:hypothetical protein
VKAGHREFDPSSQAGHSNWGGAIYKMSHRHSQKVYNPKDVNSKEFNPHGGFASEVTEKRAGQVKLTGQDKNTFDAKVSVIRNI